MTYDPLFLIQIDQDSGNPSISHLSMKIFLKVEFQVYYIFR